MQVKLLRVIQEKTVRPVGEAKESPVDARILSATHKPLAAEVAAGRFREDLFYRVNVIEIRVPPLRERLEDVPELVESILHKLGKDMGQPAPALTDAALKALCDYPFPGNVRELENILERAATLCAGTNIDVGDLQLRPAAGALEWNAAGSCGHRWRTPGRLRWKTSNAMPSSGPWSRRATTRRRPPHCSA